MAVVLALGLAAQAFAQAGPPGMPPGAPPPQAPPSEGELLQGVAGDLRKRLDLSDDQMSDLRPILLDYVRALAAIRDGLRAETITTIEALHGMRREGEKTADQVVPILTPEQVTKYEKYRSQERRRIAAEIEAQGGGGP